MNISKHVGAYEEFWCQYSFYLRDWVETLHVYAYLFPSECWAVPALSVANSMYSCSPWERGVTVIVLEELVYFQMVCNKVRKWNEYIVIFFFFLNKYRDVADFDCWLGSTCRFCLFSFKKQTYQKSFIYKCLYYKLQFSIREHKKGHHLNFLTGLGKVLLGFSAVHWITGESFAL